MTDDGMTGGAELPEAVPGFPDFGHISLQGLPNTRDLGGLPTADGRRIARRRLIRSGALHHATSVDLEQLRTMHDMERVVDFRTDAERQADPDPKQKLPGIVFYDLPVFQESAIGITHEGGLAGDVKALERFRGKPFEAVRQLYPECLLGEEGMQAYSDFLRVLLGARAGADVKALERFRGKPFEAVRQLYPECLLGEEGMQAYSDFLRVLLGARAGATLWHCTEGKDRAGLAAILVEYALGVPPEHIRADYLATNRFVRTWAEKMLDHLAQHHLLEGVDADIDAIFYAQMEYYDAAFDAVRKEFGSVDNYLHDGLDFGPDLLEGVDADIDAIFYAQMEYYDAAFDAVRKEFGSVDNYLHDGLDFGPDAVIELRERYLE